MKKKYRIPLIIVGILLLLHLALPFILVHFVNKTLKDIPDYTGSVDWIHVNLFRGAYTIHTLEILKIGAEAPEPFFHCSEIDLSIEWQALFDGSIVGEIIVTNPELLFIPPYDSTSSDETYAGQTGENVDWTEPIKDLMPLKINRFEIINGQVQYKDLVAEPNVDIALNQLDVLVTNLSNSEGKPGELPSSLKISAISVGDGQLSVDGGLNIIKTTPDFDINLSFEKVNLVALNDFMKAYIKADVNAGELNFYSEVKGKDGELTGYAKPLILNLDFVSWEQDKDQPLLLIWEAVLGGITEIFENQRKDQFGTKIPITGTYSKTGIDILPTLGNMLRNAFIDAFKLKTDNSIEYSEDGDKN